MPGERLPPLVMPIKSLATEAEEGDRPVTSNQKRGRKRKNRQGKGHAWDNESEARDDSAGGDGRQMFWMAIIGMALLSFIVIWVVTAMFRGNAPDSQSLAPVGPGSLPETVAETVLLPNQEKSDAAILAEAEPLVKNFLETSKTEDLLALVRHPEVTEARMRDYYQGGVIKAPGLAAFNTASQLTRLGPIVSVRVRTRDYEDRSVALVDSPQGLKIDWESWVGWSEMPWQEFLTTKPTSPKVFRVYLSPVDYFNFTYSDDSKWRSYRLESPDGEHAVFGYVERGTVLDSRLIPPPDAKQVALTLSLRFPENATSGNQVNIEKVIAEGWVLENEETQ